MRRRYRKTKIQEYFYGRKQVAQLKAASSTASVASSASFAAAAASAAQYQLSPHRLTMNISDLVLFKAGGTTISEGRHFCSTLRTFAEYSFLSFT